MKINLSKLLLKNKNLIELLASAANVSTECWGVEDTDGQLIFGKSSASTTNIFDITVEAELVGQVKSETVFGKFMASLLENWLRQQAEKHQIAAETLHLYREINLVFSYSEKISNALTAQEIANTTLIEAAQIIRFTSGGVFFSNSKNGKANLLAQSDATFTEQAPTNWIQNILKKSKSEIFTSVSDDLSEKMWLYAAMKIGDKLLGGLILYGDHFTSADLKFTSTLAAQAAAALENAMKHERFVAEAMKTQKAKLTFELALKNPFFKKMMGIINVQYLNPDFSVSELSNSLNMSPSQLQRKLSSLTNLSALQIIRDLRFASAKSLLLTTQLTVSEVAFQSGFNDPSYFTRTFLKEFGQTPKEWKAEKTESNNDTN